MMNSTVVIVGDVSVVTDIIIAGISTLHALTIGDKAAKSNKSVEEITFILKVLLRK
jgi:vacuolar-type H+-ATPase subunit F/Vma7